MPGVGTAVSIFAATLSAGASVFSAASAAFGYFASTFAGKLLIGIATSVAGQLLQGKPEGVKQGGIQTEQTTTGDTTPQKFVVGTYGLEGHAVAPAYARRKKNTIITYILEVSNIPVTGLTDRIVINGEWATISTSAPVGRNNVETAKAIPEFQENEGTLRDHAWIWFLDGTQTAALPHLVANYSDDPDRPWTVDHILRGSAYAVMEFVRDEDLFSSLPSVRFEVEGIALYDPRKDSTVGGSGAHRWGDSSTWEWTDNPQVINYNILRGITLPTGDVWGGEVPAEDLPLDNWFAAMNECDVLIGGRKQFVAGFEIDTNEMRPLDVIREMNKASFAQMSEFGGVFRVRVGAPSAPVMTITDDDFVITESGSYEPFPGLDNTHNFITGTYPEPEAVWEGASADAIESAQWEAEDGDRRLPMSMDLPAVANKSQVQHLLTAYVKDERRFRVHQLGLPPSFAMLEPLDTISWNSDINGYTNKIFEVMEVEDRPQTMIQRVTVRERDAGDVDWTSAQDVPQPPILNYLTGPDPILVENFGAAGLVIQDNAGADRRPAIKLTWGVDDLEDNFSLQWQVRLASSKEIVAQGITAARDGERIVTTGIVPGVAYEARVNFILPLTTAWSAWRGANAPNARFTEDDFNFEETFSALQSQTGETVNTFFDAFDVSLKAVSDLDVAVEQDINSLENSLTSQINSVSADLTNNYYTAAGTDSAISTAVQTVSTEVGDLETEVTTISQSVDGVRGVHGVRINNNGHISGYGLISELEAGTATSEFVVVADQFSVVAPNGGQETQPFFVLTSPTVIDGVTVPPGVYIEKARIGEAWIDTLNVANNAITDAVSISRSGSTLPAGDTISSGNSSDLGSLSVVTSEQGKVRIEFNITMRVADDTPPTGFRVGKTTASATTLIGSSQFAWPASTAGDFRDYPVSIVAEDTDPTGDDTYFLRVSNLGTGGLGLSSLIMLNASTFVLQVKR